MPAAIPEFRTAPEWPPGVIRIGRSRPRRKFFGPGYKTGRAGSGRYRGRWVTRRVPGTPGTPGTPGATPAKPPDIPYAEYQDYPWAQRAMMAIDREQKAHQDYVTGQVQPWLSGALTGLTGVDPSNPGYLPSANAQYMANVRNAGVSGYGAAAQAMPIMPAPTTPGGIVAAPNAYLGQAARELGASMASTSLQSAEAEKSLANLTTNTMSQAYINSLADYSKGLPAMYAERRREQREAIDQWISEFDQARAELALDRAKFEEDKRSNRVREGISMTNAQAQMLLGLGRLGLDTSKAAQDFAGPAAPPSDIPPGYQVIPDDKGGWSLEPIPGYGDTGGGGGGSQYPGGGTSTRNRQGRRRPGVIEQEQFTKLPKRYIRNGKPFGVNRKVFKLEQASNGQWYILRKKDSSGGSTSKPKTKSEGDLVTDLAKRYGPGEYPEPNTWAGLSRGNPDRAAQYVFSWVAKNRASFVKPDGSIRRTKLRNVLIDAVGGSAVVDRVMDLVTARWGR